MNWNKARIFAVALGTIGFCTNIALAADISGNWQVNFNPGSGSETFSRKMIYGEHA